MKKRFHKLTALLLSALMVCSVVTTGEVSVGAAEVGVENIVSESSGTTGDCTWTLDNDGTLWISGNGEIPDYGYSVSEETWRDAPWYDYREYIKSVVIQDGVTTVGTRAFYDCINITSVRLPNTLKRLGTQVFWFCESLSSINLPERLEKIESGPFGYTQIKELQIPASVSEIDLIHDQTVLENINVSENNLNFYSINGVLFRTQDHALISYPNKNSRKSYSIPVGTEKIERNAFRGRNNLEELEIPGTVKELTSQNFYYNQYSRVTLCEGVETINKYSFLNCNIREFSVPKSVTNIGDKAIGYTDLDGPSPTKLSDTVIYGYNQTTAEEYANQNEFQFVAMDSESTSDGDVSGDGKIDISDVTAIQRHLAELELFTEEQLAVSDTNGDGETNIDDATHLQLYLAGYHVALGKQN